ncbi:hypothetical protein [Nocardioides sp. WS12]|uniref:hypothetical protein n=1 Tax=Nocardioides sp. WS12 TaxID=2486272 RepID=UPI0015FD1D9C|nr:hypothetical protein [Nocardioides sp. WS12]
MKKLLAAIVACCCVSLTGCGDDEPAKSDDKPSETVEPTLTRDEVIKQGDAICAASNEKIDAANDNFINPEEPTEAEFRVAVTDVVIPEIRSQITDLRALKAPADDVATIASMLAALETDLATLETDPLALLQDTTFAEADEIAQDYGFLVCGTG